jgi:hypothetical protein
MPWRKGAGYHFEEVKLDRGHFRCWSYSDFGTNPLKCPLVGSYAIKGNRLVLHCVMIRKNGRVGILDRVNGIPVAWSNHGWSIWSERREIDP